MYGPSKLDKCWILKRKDPLNSLLSFLRRDDFVTPEIVHRRLPTDLLHEGSAFGAKLGHVTASVGSGAEEPDPREPEGSGRSEGSGSDPRGPPEPRQDP